jgi:WD40 repeat protein/serine/threonine protein kinase
MPTRCPFCQAQLKESARFCINCGSPVTGNDLAPGTRLLNNIYEVVQLVSKGGMGALYKVKDFGFLGKIRALKEMLDNFTEQKERDEAIAWFKREAEILETLRNPNIPTVRASFIERGRYYLVMDFIEGKNLESLAMPIDEKQAITIALTALNILEYLHGQRIIHRDIKPENFIKETATGTLFLVDFGTATIFAGRKKVTAIGTQGYASPEHYEGITDERSDIYSLGATLHRLITGVDPKNRAPFKFDAVRKLNSGISESFAAIIEKALSYQPQDRFQSAGEMRKAIEDLEPKHSDEEKEVSELKSQLEKLKNQLKSAAAVNKAAQGGRDKGKEEAKEVMALKSQVEKLKNQLASLKPGAEPAASSPASQPPSAAPLIFAKSAEAPRGVPAGGNSSKPTVTEAPALQPAPPANTPGASAPQVRDKGALFFKAPSASLKAHNGSAHGIAFSPVGMMLASGGADKMLRLWNLETGKEASSWTDGFYEIRALAFSPDGSLLATASGDAVKIHRPGSQEKPRSLMGHSAAVTTLLFTPGGTYVISGSADITIIIWEKSTWSKKTAFHEHRREVTSLAVSRNGRVLASGSLDGMVYLFDMKTLSRYSQIEIRHDSVMALALSPAENILACALASGTIRLHDTVQGTYIRDLTGHKGRITSLSFAPDGGILASGGEDCTVRFWDIKKGISIGSKTESGGEIRALCHSPGGRLIAWAAGDGSIRLWKTDELFSAPEAAENSKAAPGKPETTRQGETPPVRPPEKADKMGQGVAPLPQAPEAAVAVTPPSQAASAKGQPAMVPAEEVVSVQAVSPPSLTGAIRVPAKPRLVLEGHKRGAQCAAFAHGDALIAVGSGDGDIRLWDLAKGELKHIIMKGGKSLIADLGEKLKDALIATPEDISALAFAAQDEYLYSASLDHHLKVWQSPFSGRETAEFIHRKKLLCLALSKDGKKLAAGSRGEIILFEALSGTIKRTASLSTGDDWVNALAFSPDGTILASGDERGFLCLWNVAAGISTHALKEHSDKIIDLCFSLDGRFIATASLDSTIALWGAAEVKKIRAIEDKGDGIRGVKILAGSGLIASATDVGKVKVWASSSGKLHTVLEGHKGAVNALALSDNGASLASCGDDEKVLMWEFA